jgi:hypothetical protein
MTMFFRGFRQCSEDDCIAIFEVLAGGGTIDQAAERVGQTQKGLLAWYNSSPMCMAAIKKGFLEADRSRRQEAEAKRKNAEAQAKLRQRVQDREAYEIILAEEQKNREWMARRQREAAEQNEIERQARERSIAEREEKERIERQRALIEARALTERLRAERLQHDRVREALRLAAQEEKQERINREDAEKRARRLKKQAPKKRGRPRKVVELVVNTAPVKIQPPAPVSNLSKIAQFWVGRGLCVESAEIMAGERKPKINPKDTCHGAWAPPLYEEWHRTKIMSARGCWA